MSAYAQKSTYNKSSVRKPAPSPSVVNYSDWQPSLCIMGAAKKNQGGLGKSAPVTSPQTGGAWPSIRTPAMLSWGASEYVDPKKPDEAGKWSLSLQFPSADYPSPEGDAFRAKLEEFDRRIIKCISDVSPSLYGKFRSEESVTDMFTGSLKFSKDKETKVINYDRAPTFNPKIRVYPNEEGIQEWKLSVYNNAKQLVFPPEQVIKAGQTPAIDDTTGLYLDIKAHLPKLSKVVVLATPKVWILEKTCGVTWTIQQVKVAQLTSTKGLEGCQFADDDDEYEENDGELLPVAEAVTHTHSSVPVVDATVASAPVAPVVPAPVAPVASAPVASDAQEPVVVELEEDTESDDSEADASGDDAPEPEPEPEPVQVVAKKGLKKPVAVPVAVPVEPVAAAPVTGVKKTLKPKK
jgi:hypothetical protein